MNYYVGMKKRNCSNASEFVQMLDFYVVQSAWEEKWNRDEGTDKMKLFAE